LIYIEEIYSIKIFQVPEDEHPK